MLILIQHFDTVLNNFGTGVHDWILCQIYCNAAVNIQISALMGKFHVGSLIHKLNLEVNRIIEADEILHSTLKEVKRKMCKCSAKNQKSRNSNKSD